MDTERVQDWLQIVGLAAVVGSLIFVGLQVKQADDIALADVLESSSARGVEQRALIVANADTWQKACLGSELTAAEKVVAGNIYFNYVQSIFNAWELLDQTDIGGISSKYLINGFAANIHRYPGFKNMGRSFSEWDQLAARYDDDVLERFISELRGRVAELEQLDPNPNYDVMWCGVK